MNDAEILARADKLIPLITERLAMLADEEATETRVLSTVFRFVDDLRDELRRRQT
jgi:hypothetical protein